MKKQPLTKASHRLRAVLLFLGVLCSVGVWGETETVGTGTNQTAFEGTSYTTSANMMTGQTTTVSNVEYVKFRTNMDTYTWTFNVKSGYTITGISINGYSNNSSTTADRSIYLTTVAVDGTNVKTGLTDQFNGGTAGQAPNNYDYTELNATSTVVFTFDNSNIVDKDKDPNGKNAQIFAVVTITYQILTTTVTLSATDADNQYTTSVTATNGSAMPSIATLPTRSGYTFTGYYDAASDGTKYYNADGSSTKNWDKEDATTTLYAQWTKNGATYAITKGSHENGNFTISPTGNQAEGTSITLTPAPETGYQLASWNVYKTGESGTTVEVTDNTFSMPAYAVTVDATFEAVPEPTSVDFTIDFRTNPYTLSGTYMSSTTVTSGNFNDKQHGYNSPVASIPVPGNVKLTIGTCQYGSAKTIQVLNGENVVGTAAGKTTTCSEAVIYYSGEATTLTVNCGNYCPYIKVATYSPADIPNKNAAGTQYEVIANSAKNLKACLDAAQSDASCKKVYIPNGTYDMGTLTTVGAGSANPLYSITASGLTITGESMDGVIITGTINTENLKQSLIYNKGTDNTFENLTLYAVAPWSGSAERAHAMHDEGSNTVYNNVYLKGLQDTYFSNTAGAKTFTGGKIEGTVDFICGGGQLTFNNVELACVASTNHTSQAVIIAPDAATFSGT